MTEQWRMQLVTDADSFFRDVTRLRIGYRSSQGWRFVTLTMEVSEVVAPEATAVEPPVTELPTELAELLMSTLAHHLLGKGDLVRAYNDLEHRLHKSETRLDNLLTGLASMTRNQTKDIPPIAGD